MLITRQDELNEATRGRDIVFKDTKYFTDVALVEEENVKSLKSINDHEVVIMTRAQLAVALNARKEPFLSIKSRVLASLGITTNIKELLIMAEEIVKDLDFFVYVDETLEIAEFAEQIDNGRTDYQEAE